MQSCFRTNEISTQYFFGFSSPPQKSQYMAYGYHAYIELCNLYSEFPFGSFTTSRFQFL